MQVSKITTLIGIMLVTLATSISAQHYYGGGQQIPLTIDSNRVTIRFNDDSPVSQQSSSGFRVASTRNPTEVVRVVWTVWRLRR